MVNFDVLLKLKFWLIKNILFVTKIHNSYYHLGYLDFHRGFVQ